MELPPDRSESPMDIPSREKVFEAIRERLIAVARKRIQGEAYQDVVQEAMMILSSKLGQIDTEREMMPYVFQVLRNCIGNYYQKIRRERKVMDFSMEPVLDYPSRDENFDWLDVIKKALSHLRKMNPKCTKLFEAILRSAEIDELQSLMNLDAENVYRTLYRCRGHLKEIITTKMRISLP